VEDELAVFIGEAAAKLTQAVQEVRGLTVSSSFGTVGGEVFREQWNVGQSFPVVKELVHGNFESAVCDRPDLE
jgi:hypothetical protein